MKGEASPWLTLHPHQRQPMAGQRGNVEAEPPCLPRNVSQGLISLRACLWIGLRSMMHAYLCLIPPASSRPGADPQNTVRYTLAGQSPNPSLSPADATQDSSQQPAPLCRSVCRWRSQGWPPASSAGKLTNGEFILFFPVRFLTWLAALDIIWCFSLK